MAAGTTTKTRTGGGSPSPSAAVPAVAEKCMKITGKHLRAATLLAEDEKTDEAIAVEVGISVRQLGNWKTHPDFAALVGDAHGKIIAEALRLPIARKHQRVRELNDLNASYWRIIQDRAERHRQEREDNPGNAARAVFGDVTPAEAETGMLVAQPKIAANGKTVVEWAFDKALDSAIKETHKQAAQELGQWVDKRELSGPGGGAIAITGIEVPRPPMDGDE